MAFIRLIIKNIWRNKSRTVLTVLGISLGIGTIVLLGVLTGGMKKSLEATLKTGDADFTVAQANVADFSFSQVTDEQVKEIQDNERVEEAVGVLWGFAKTEGNPFFVLFGLEEDDTELMGVNLIDGRLFDDNKREAVIGKVASENLDLKLGDELPIRNEKFKIVGIFQTGNPLQDGGALVPLERLQKIEKKENKVTMVLVKVTDDVKDIDKFSKDIEKKFKDELVALVEIGDYSSVDQGLEITDFLSTSISVLAVFIGGIGVMNTIMMSVFERTREIGILRAIGWKRRRILAMILGESLLLGVISIVIGTLLGLLVVQYIFTFPVAQSFFKPDYSPIIFINAIAVGILVSFLGGFYPAYRAARFSPAEALRYE